MSDENRDVADDEIEILEVIGLDEDSPAARPRRTRDEMGSEDTDVDVVVLEEEPTDAVPDPPAAPEGKDDSPVSPEVVARLAADFEGLRRRVEREREANERHAAARLIERLLPVLDNFERALGSAPGAAGPGFHDGIALIFRQLLEELRREGLTAVDSVGEPFDPEIHEAVLTTRDPDLPPNTVVEEMQRGYLLHERLLRPALVKVTLDPEFDDGGAGGEGEP